ncbi:hypothetical protein ACFE04_024045 [Oxalis oulophora]
MAQTIVTEFKSLSIHHSMDDSKVHDIDPVVYDFPGFEYRNNDVSQSLSEILKCCLLRIAVDGAERLVKDKKSWKSKSVMNGINHCSCERRFSAENGKTWSPSPKICGESSFEVKTNQALQENKRLSSKSNFPVVLMSQKDVFDEIDQWSNVSGLVNYSLGNCIDFPLNCIAFFSMMLMKFVGFQFNMFVSFVTLPLWLSYFSCMTLMFPLRTLRNVRGYIITSLLTLLGASTTKVKVKVRNSAVNVAMRLGWGVLSSIYVGCVLVGLLASGFLVGALVMKCIMEKPIYATETLNFDYSQHSPVAFVPIMSSPDSPEPFGLVSNVNFDSEKPAGARVIPYNHKLLLTVSLMLPESEYNRKLGIFQVSVQFLSVNGKVTASSRKPSMLQFKSHSIRLAETMIKSAPLIAGFQSESQILNIKMKEFTEGLEPTACLKVTLEQRAEYKSGAGIPEIYAASLILESRLPLMKRVVWLWRKTIFVWISFAFFFTELAVVIIFCRPVIMPRGKPRMLYINKGFDSKKIPWYKSY